MKVRQSRSCPESRIVSVLYLLHGAMIGKGGSMLENQMQEKPAARTRERKSGGVGQVMAKAEASSVGTGSTYLHGGVPVYFCGNSTEIAL